MKSAQNLEVLSPKLKSEEKDKKKKDKIMKIKKIIIKKHKPSPKRKREIKSPRKPPKSPRKKPKYSKKSKPDPDNPFLNFKLIGLEEIFTSENPILEKPEQ